MSTANTQMYVGNSNLEGVDIEGCLRSLLHEMGYSAREITALLKQCEWDGLAYGEPLYFRFPAELLPLVRAQELLDDVRAIKA